MRYLAGEEILAIHSEIIDKTGGTHGVRDPGLLLSIIEKPKMTFGGKPLYQGVFRKAAVYVEAFARYHVFVDGNKRTAMATGARFLFLNGFDLTATNNELEHFALRVAAKRLDIEGITYWIKQHSRKLKHGA